MIIVPANRKPISEIIEIVLTVLQNGGLVVYPTETTYGIGADCENPQAVATLLEYKGKRDGKALSVAVSDQAMAEKYVLLNDTAKNIYKTFLPGPVTVISKSMGKVALGIESQQGNVGIRIPNYPLMLDIIKAYGKGITATGANASNKKRPYTVQDIFDNISDKQKSLVDLVIDAGELPHNEPSTVIDTTLDDVQVMRAGSIQFSNSKTIQTNSVEETISVAQKLISEYRSYLTYTPIILALCGEMGAGKTHFVKGIAQGLGIADTITSPTYTLSTEYHFTSESRDGTFTHIDTWRMHEAEELEGIGIKEMIQNKNVICIEWADRFQEFIQSQSEAKIIWIRIEQATSSESKRSISISTLTPTP